MANGEIKKALRYLEENGFELDATVPGALNKMGINMSFRDFERAFRCTSGTILKDPDNIGRILIRHPSFVMPDDGKTKPEYALDPKLWAESAELFVFGEQQSLPVFTGAYDSHDIVMGALATVLDDDGIRYSHYPYRTKKPTLIVQCDGRLDFTSNNGRFSIVGTISSDSLAA